MAMLPRAIMSTKQSIFMPNDLSRQATQQKKRKEAEIHGIERKPNPKCCRRTTRAHYMEESWEKIADAFGRLFCFRGALRGVIVDDAPALRKLLHHQSKDAANVPGLPLQVPFSQHQRCLRTQWTDFEF